MVRLAPMTESDFDSYYQKGVASYAEENVRGGHWSAEEALEKSAAEYRKLLPDGLATPDHYLYTIEDATTHTAVGLLWFALQRRGGQATAFVYDVSIHPPYRRQGYATRAFQALEERARELGARQIQLHVFGHNHGARALYEKLGFVPTNIIMSKALDS